jgi:hypothetical protein
MYPGGLQTVMPMSKWQSLFDYFRTASYDPRPPRLVDTVNAPVGQVGVSSARWFLSPIDKVQDVPLITFVLAAAALVGAL